MFKSTMNSAIPATFNAALLFDSISKNKIEQAKFLDFLKSKNIRDYRIGANESTNKGHSFCDLGFELTHHLFDSINFHQLFGVDNEEALFRKKMDVYNDVVGYLKLNMFNEYKDAIINSASEYSRKIRVYTEPLIQRSIELHKTTDELGTTEEGVQNFWYLVDHFIFINKVKHELEQLKAFMANV